jgi:hypothetical protein
MWIFLNDAFVPTGADRDHRDRSLIRARLTGEIQLAFGDNVQEIETPDADYRFRAFMPGDLVGGKDRL